MVKVLQEMEGDIAPSPDSFAPSPDSFTMAFFQKY